MSENKQGSGNAGANSNSGGNANGNGSGTKPSWTGTTVTKGGASGETRSGGETTKKK